MRLLLFVLSLLMSQFAFGGVNLKNGNWHISYSDILVPGAGEDLEIIRNYNSKAIDVGWFGLGWGSTYETYLRPSADGSVIIQENGAGALTRFVPKTSIDPKEAVQKIISEMKKRSSLTSSVEEKLMNKLINDQELRQSYAKKFKVSASIASGTILYSNDRGLQQVHKLKDGYKRVYNNGKIEFLMRRETLLKSQIKMDTKLI